MLPLPADREACPGLGRPQQGCGGRGAPLAPTWGPTPTPPLQPSPAPLLLS